MRAIIVAEHLKSEEICLEIKKKTIRVRCAKKAKRLFNRSIDKKEEYGKLKKALNLKKGMNTVSKTEFLKVVADFSEKEVA